MRQVFLAILFSCSVFLAETRYMVLFGDHNCNECASLKELWKEIPMAEKPVMVYVPVDIEDNYRFLKRLEKALHLTNPRNAFPVILVGRTFLAGEDELLERFQELNDLLENTPHDEPLLKPIAECAKNAKEEIVEWSVSNELDENEVSTTPRTDGAGNSHEYHLLYLELASSCAHCERQERELVILKELLPTLVIDKAEVSSPEGQLYLLRLMEHFGIQENNENLAPLVAWENGYITQNLATCEELQDALSKPIIDKKPFWIGPATKEEIHRLQQRNRIFIERATIWTTLLAGLLDGINPCAFATAIFLISYLLYLKKGRKFVLAVGLCFCLGVFLSYLCFGIGLSFLVDFLNRIKFIKTLLYGSFALIGLVLFVLHLRDALRFRKSGNVGDMDMGLDVKTHRKIHEKIHNWGRVSFALALPSAVVLGVVVSSLEFVCTGQIYLPMLVAINSQGFHWKAFQSLLIYNIAFIVPLLTISILAFYGVGAQTLANWAKNHVFQTKILMALLFLIMAALMIAMIF